MDDLLERLRAALAGRYRVEREIGRGGMAHVFLAHDLKLDRPVAVKTLRPELAAAVGSERFLREIALAAKLEHPHILGIHDCGEADGCLYYVMPHVEGESLRQRLERERQLPLDDALQIAREVTDALSYAHAHGIIHRDIKPENILLKAGHAVVADFGIGKAVAGAGEERLTETGMAIGTPAYMSPEQALGSADVDGRTDLYSLGCVLYEMLSGETPYTGPTPQAILAKKVSEPLPRISVVREAVPAYVEAALAKALAKTPADRFQPVGQFAEALVPRAVTAEVVGLASRGGRRRWLGWGAGAVAVGGLIAALAIWGPRSAGQADVAEDVGALPAVRPWVIVAEFEGTAEASYRQTARDLVSAALDQSTVAATLPAEQIARGLELAEQPESTRLTAVVARELAVRGGIASVVTGQVDRVGATYAVLLRLVRAESGEVMAVERRTAASDDALIPVLDSAVRVFRERLGEQGASLAGHWMPDVMTASFDAYQKYVTAFRIFSEGSVGERGQAERLLREAVALDSEFGSAWLLLGEVARDSAASAEAWRRPERLTDSERLRRECFSGRTPMTPSQALVECERWVQGAPNDPNAWNGLGVTVLRLQGAQAHLDLLDRAVDLAPFWTQGVAWNRVWLLVQLGRRAEARQELWRWPRQGAFWFARLIAIAVLDGSWSEVDSLVPLWHQAVLTETGQPADTRYAALRHLVRGEVRAAEDARPGWDGGLLWQLATGSPVSHPDSSDVWRSRLTLVWERAFRLAVAGDTVAARAALAALTIDSLSWWERYYVQSGYLPAATEAAIASQRGDWAAVVQHTGLWLRDRPKLGFITAGFGVALQWLTAKAYERLGRLDSAVVVLEALVEPKGFLGHWNEFLYGPANPYLRQHLIVLLARLGRVDEAWRHWEIFRSTFTNPDPEYAHLIDEARAALEEAERKAK